VIVRSKSKLKKIIEDSKKEGKSVLVKKGVFDIIHPGHVYAIQQFKKKADVVIILIQSDEFTAKKKGKDRPINNQEQRMLVMDGLKGVDYVAKDNSMSRSDYIKFLNYLKPTILAVASTDEQKTREYTSPYWKLIQFPDKKKKGFSTTEIINKILKK
jgi:cytidyltransferase-like protein